MNIGFLGAGGLGTMGIRLARAMGNQITVISPFKEVKEIALQKGAHNFIDSTNPDQMKDSSLKFDLILDTVPDPHQISSFLPLLSVGGTYVIIGAFRDIQKIDHFDLLFHRRTITCSLIGSIRDSQDCLDFCRAHDVYPDIQMIGAPGIQEAWDTLMTGNKAGVRYVVDI